VKERLIGENHVCNRLLWGCTREMRNSRFSWCPLTLALP
jgi:hypothetical protein